MSVSQINLCVWGGGGLQMSTTTKNTLIHKSRNRCTNAAILCPPRCCALPLQSHWQGVIMWLEYPWVSESGEPFKRGSCLLLTFCVGFSPQLIPWLLRALTKHYFPLFRAQPDQSWWHIFTMCIIFGLLSERKNTLGKNVKTTYIITQCSFTRQTIEGCRKNWTLLPW